MAGDIPEQLVVKHNLTGIQNRIYQAPTDTVLCDSLSKQSRPGTGITKRSKLSTRKKSHQTSPKMPGMSGILLSSVPDKEASRELQVYPESEEIKQGSPLQEIPNGQHSLSDKSATRGLLVNLSRPQRRLPTSANSPRITAIPEVRSGSTRRENEDHFSKKSYGATGLINSIVSCSTMGSTSFESTSKLDFIQMGQEVIFPRQEVSDSLECQALSSLVAGGKSSLQRKSLGLSNPDCNNYRRKLRGLGSTSEYSSCSRSMVCTSSQTIFKQQGVASCMGSTSGIPDSDSPIPCDYSYGQQYSSGLPEPAGGYEEQSLKVPSIKDSSLGRKESTFLKSSTSERDAQLSSRLFKQMEPLSRRMEPKRSNISRNIESLGGSTSRSVCKTNQYEMPSILFPVPTGQSMGSGRILNQLEPAQDVRLSPSTSHLEGFEQDMARPSTSHSGCSFLAQETLVCSTSALSLRPSDPSMSTGSTDPGPSVSSQSDSSSAFGMEPEWRILKSKGFSNSLSETLIQSRKKVTRQIYHKAWKTYLSWCLKNEMDTSHSNSVLEFLQCGFQKGLSISTLKVQVSALSVYLERRLAEEEYVVRFFKATRRLRPVVQSKIPSWDLNTVLQALCELPFEPISDISDKLLTLKTAFLLAITTARRIGELQALSINEPYCVISEDRITLRLDVSFLPKVSSKFHRSQEIFLPSFCNNPSNQKENKLHSLDVRRCVIEYLQRSKSWRKSNALLVLFAGKFRGKQASRPTIARWIKQAIALSYFHQGKQLVSTIRAHSTRAVSTSWAERAGATIEQICKAATWSSHNTFVKHYKLDVLSNSDLCFGRKVLQAVVPP
ncbi:uncharacterized protein [Hyperolius riggenbachi]|uniref:uncharacterized protein n=1 Tax=Hyperolius riggenbachi TaxID=752182 RepID=UPI0035A34B81